MAEAIVSNVVQRLTDLLIEETRLLHGVRDEIEQVVIELRRMKTFLKDAYLRLNENEIRSVVADIREVAYGAEHVVESFLVTKALSTGKAILWMNTSKFSKKIECIKRKIVLVFNRFRDYSIRSTLESMESSNFSYGKLKRFYSYTIVEPEIFVGFHEDVDRLVGHLVNENDDCYPLISICGMGGLGKTTLAQKIYNHSIIRTYFAGLAWVSISQKWQAKHVLQRILICLVPEKKNEILTLDNYKLVENLRQIQQRKRCLIVLDDIWSTDAWDSLKAAFTAERSTSKLMLTSRNVDVPHQVNSKGFIYQPKFLSADQSWELLRLKAIPGRDDPDNMDVEKFEELGRKMVGNCAGLPLAIVILGGILVTKPRLREWEKVYDDSLSSLKRGKGLGENYQNELFDVLLWSYNDLPPQLKPCFLYLGKYCEDELIEVETLYQLWIAEGMVLSSDKREGETMMQVAESYLGELVHKSMVQVTFNDKRSSFAKFKYCFLHDLMRDLCISQAKTEDLFEIVDLRKGNDFHHNSTVDTRQLVVYFDDGYTSKNANSYFLQKVNRQRYRSMLLMNEFETRTLPPVLVSHVANFRLLRVFSLEGVHFDGQTVSGSSFRIYLGRILGGLSYLRYLSVRNTKLLNFPPIQKLVLLQTLKLDVQNDIYFPPWRSRHILSKLAHLRHLYLPKQEVHSLRNKLKLRFDGLSKLETLENFNTSWCEAKDLPLLVSLQKLRLKVAYSEVDEMMNYLTAIALSSSSCLRYLALTILCNLRWGNGPDILRQLLWDHNYNLQELTIIGQLPELAQLFEWQEQQLHNTRIDLSLIRITNLSLSLSCLEEDPMPVLEKIPTLCELDLFRIAFVGEKMVCSARGFPKLTRLFLGDLPNLVNWSVEEGSMPILSELVIRECSKLEELPAGMIFLISLKKLLLQAMPSDFCDKLKVVNGEAAVDYFKVAHISSLFLEGTLV